jgi:hypothetical protein
MQRTGLRLVKLIDKVSPFFQDMLFQDMPHQAFYFYKKKILKKAMSACYFPQII